MVPAINCTGDCLFTQINGTLSLLEKNNISLVVLLVKKTKTKSIDIDIDIDMLYLYI